MIGTSLGHFRVEGEIGRGGMGEVYRARDTDLDRVVALKVLPAAHHADAIAHARLLREARLASALNHPHICTIHEVGESEGRPYIAMEYCEGRPLSALISSGALPLEQTVRYASQVAAALAHAHERGVIHRDLKSSNVVITPDGRAKVLDFGLAQRTPSDVDAATRSRVSVSETSGVSGTLHCLAPEVLRGDPPDARSDIWSFGVMLYEMVTGHLPFRGATGFEVSSAILRESPAALPANLPAGLRGIIQRCLEKEPGGRYSSAGEIRAALETVSLDTSGRVPVQTAAPSPARGRNVRRAALLAVGILIVFAALAAWKLRGRFSGGNGGGQGIKSVAILPFRPMAGGADDEGLGMGIADTIITKVSQIDELRVRPASAVRKYAGKEIDALQAAKELQADAVLDAAWQRSGDRIRINVNLLRASDGSSLWSESFNQNFTDIFDLQDQIAQKVAEGLRVKLTPTERARVAKRYTSNSEAYEYFLKGHAALDRRSITSRPEIDEAIRHLRRAIELDPNYAQAHAKLAYAYVWMALFIEPENPEWRTLAEQAMQRADALDPGLAETNLAKHELAWSIYGGFNIEQAIRELRLAQQADPNVGHQQLGVLYAHLGLEKATARELKLALEIDPTSESVQSWYVEVYDLTGRPDEAIALYKDLREPAGASPFLRRSFLWKRQFDRAEELIRQDLKRNPGDAFAESQLLMLGALRDADFRTAEAKMPGLIQRTQRSRAFHHMTYTMAGIYALQGKAAPAVEWLRKTVDTGMPNCTLFSRDPNLDAIRKSPEFVQFIKELQPRCDRYAREFGG